MSHAQVATSRQKNVTRLSPCSWDMPLIVVVAALLGIGLVMVGSASMPVADKLTGDPLYYLQRQAMFVFIGIAVAIAFTKIPMEQWRNAGPMLLLLAFILLVMVLIPGVGKKVNGSIRWLPLGFFQLQVSELVKMCVLIYLAGYLLRRGEEVRNTAKGFVKPMVVLILAVFLLLLEPDFGAAVVLLATSLGMMYMAGVGLLKFGALLAATVAAMGVLAVATPYRVARIMSFLNPWEDPFNSGFQLTQSLIAFGRGEWFGVGLGGSIQKLFYLPETHTDFLYAILAEELGLFGAVIVIALFAMLVWRAFIIGARAERVQQHFSAYLAYGIGLWIGLQAFVNIGVNMGVLPTKGLTLPLMSYGGSSIVVTCMSLAILLRIGHEAQEQEEVQRMRGDRK